MNTSPRIVDLTTPAGERRRQLEAAARLAIASPRPTRAPAELKGAQVTRLRLMYAALKDGLELGADARSWPSLSPLKAGKHGIDERAGVLRERDRLLELAPAERAAELLNLAAQIVEARS